MDNGKKITELVEDYKKHSLDRKQKINRIHKDVNELFEDQDKHNELKDIDNIFDDII
jgi:hypothetical protein